MQIHDFPFGITDWASVPAERKEGETELKDRREFILRPGMSYQVADHAEPHRSSTVGGAKLFVVDLASITKCTR